MAAAAIKQKLSIIHTRDRLPINGCPSHTARAGKGTCGDKHSENSRKRRIYPLPGCCLKNHAVTKRDNMSVAKMKKHCIFQSLMRGVDPTSRRQHTSQCPLMERALRGTMLQWL